MNSSVEVTSVENFSGSKKGNSLDAGARRIFHKSHTDFRLPVTIGHTHLAFGEENIGVKLIQSEKFSLQSIVPLTCNFSQRYRILSVDRDMRGIQSIL